MTMEEKTGLEALLAQAENKDKTQPVIFPMNAVCSLDDEECLTCGS